MLCTKKEKKQKKKENRDCAHDVKDIVAEKTSRYDVVATRAWQPLCKVRFKDVGRRVAISDLVEHGGEWELTLRLCRWILTGIYDAVAVRSAQRRELPVLSRWPAAIYLHESIDNDGAARRAAV